MAGRKPKGTRLHALHGTDRADRANPAEPQPEALLELPDPPPHLDLRATEIWHELGTELLANGILTSLDRWAFARLCALLEVVEKLESEAPSSVRLTEKSRELRQYFSDFGLNPSARSRIRVEKPKIADPLAEWERRKGAA